MLSRFVEEGSKVELRALEHGLGESGAEYKPQSNHIVHLDLYPL